MRSSDSRAALRGKLHARRLTPGQLGRSMPRPYRGPVSHTSRLHGADKIREHAVTSGLNARIVLDDRKSKNIKIKANRRTGPLQIGEWIRGQQQFRLNAAIDAVSTAFGAAHQFVAHSGAAHRTDFF